MQLEHVGVAYAVVVNEVLSVAARKHIPVRPVHAKQRIVPQAPRQRVVGRKPGDGIVARRRRLRQQPRRQVRVRPNRAVVKDHLLNGISQVADFVHDGHLICRPGKRQHHRRGGPGPAHHHLPRRIPMQLEHVGVAYAVVVNEVLPVAARKHIPVRPIFSRKGVIPGTPHQNIRRRSTVERIIPRSPIQRPHIFDDIGVNRLAIPFLCVGKDQPFDPLTGSGKLSGDPHHLLGGVIGNQGILKGTRHRNL